MPFTRFHFLHLFFASILMGMVYLHYRYVRFLWPGWKGRLLISLVLFSPVLAVFLSFSAQLRGKSGLGPEFLAWYAYLGLGFLSFLFFLVVLRDGIGMPCRFFFKIAGNSEALAAVPFSNHVLVRHHMAYTLTLVALVLSLVGIYKAHKLPDVREQTLFVRDLPEDLQGFSIVQISDIHLGPTLKKPFLEKIVRRVNELKPDVVALTGDLVDGYVEHLEGDIKPLENIRSTYGNYFVTGNHEYYFRALEWIDAVKRTGFTVLLNSHDLVEKGAGRVVVAGVPDLKAARFVPSHRSDPAAALAGAPESHVKILLSHQPLTVEQAERAGYHIQISGHTHGGQMFPWNHVVVLNQPFLAGFYRYQELQLYVSRGTGYWGPPMRLFAPSEITRFVLRKA